MKQRPQGDPAGMVGQAATLGVSLTLDQAERLIRFEGLLRDRAVPLGLVAKGDLPKLRPRHILDCLRAAAVVEPSDRDAYDLGSGAGLPGIVVAIARPGLRVLLVETQRRRGAFLEFVAANLALANVVVWIGRAERLTDPVDICFARALSPLPAAWDLARNLLRPTGKLVYFAGRGTTRSDVPVLADAVSRLVGTPVLESAGPLVIMTRQ